MAESLVREVVATYKGPKVTIGSPITSSRYVDQFARKKLKLVEQPTEHLYLLLLNAKNAATGFHLVAKGGSASCAVSLADIFRPAIASGSVGIVVIHNHPSGEPSPSPEDLALTERIAKAGTLLGVRLIDHVIIGDPEYFSFLDSGLLERP